MGRLYVRAAGWIGVLSPLVVSALVLSAILVSPWFSWTENALSDLGVSGLGAFLFNAALITGGAMLIIFAAGLWSILRGRLARVGVMLLLLDGAALSAIGVFPETTGGIHLYVSITFFTLLILSLLVLGLSYALEMHNIATGLLGISLSLFSTLVWLFHWHGVAIPEAATYLAGAVWWITLSVRSNDLV
ncbi:MAG: DUF998 domain-containing protein [Thaumarchaeota archaeon]|nr:DUF998 domain-containing protein [Nitrososphaerota archaeon]